MHDLTAWPRPKPIGDPETYYRAVVKGYNAQATSSRNRVANTPPRPGRMVTNQIDPDVDAQSPKTAPIERAPATGEVLGVTTYRRLGGDSRTQWRRPPNTR